MCAKAKVGVSIKGTPSSFILENVGVNSLSLYIAI